MKPPLEQSSGGFCFVAGGSSAIVSLSSATHELIVISPLHRIAVSIMAVLGYGGWLNRYNDSRTSEPRRDGMLLICAGVRP